MPEPGPHKKRPHAVLRALLSLWLIIWMITIAFFIRAQFDPQPLFNWRTATIWLSVSVLGWLFVFRVLQKLRRMPPE
jgi:hypothetical protein